MIRYNAYAVLTILLFSNISYAFCLFNCDDKKQTISKTTNILVAKAHSTYTDDKRIRLKFLSAKIRVPEKLDMDNFKSLSGWKTVISRRYESPDPYVVAFLNGELIFVTPQDAILEDTYSPEWGVIMKDFKYSAKDKDELTILVKDSDSDLAKKFADSLSKFRVIEDGKESGFAIQVTENSFNEDETLGRWSGKIPTNSLNQYADVVWDIPIFGDVLSLKVLIEELPMN
jgi:hypothetical protein